MVVLVVVLEVLVGLMVVLEALVGLVVVVVEGGDKSVPSVFVRKESKVLTLVKVMTELRLLLAEELGAVNTTAWNQEPPCLHISGPPESP